MCMNVGGFDGYFYSAACVRSLRSFALFGCIFGMVNILMLTRLDFQNLMFILDLISDSLVVFITNAPYYINIDTT